MTTETPGDKTITLTDVEVNLILDALGEFDEIDREDERNALIARLINE